MMFKLGKQPATVDDRDLKMARYLTALPQHPKEFGHESAIANWGVLGNDMFGDCVFAGAAHETMLWNKMAGRDVGFSEESVLSDYAGATGFNRDDPATDRGTNVRDALNFRRKVGSLDAAGVRHKIGAYVSINPKNYDQFLSAVWLFGVVGIGIQFPSFAMEQFVSGKLWALQKTNSQIDGGHYIPVVADRHRRPVCITWGRAQPMTRSFFTRYCDEAYAILSEEMLTDGRSPEGFDLAALRADLNGL